ncbi:unnamed protein product [Soboliphyme baturini]|uniref:Uncharacterized protein n=1 Tax=Soboliphyme baturini TaxID=241478 RepID=A0A183J616_9BILA|nr:unnamed protein product [Soboliphyme baturini]
MDMIIDEEMVAAPNSAAAQNATDEMCVVESWDRDFVPSFVSSPLASHQGSSVPRPFYEKFDQFPVSQRRSEEQRQRRATASSAVSESSSVIVGSYPRGFLPNKVAVRRTRYYSLTLPLPSMAIVTNDPPKNDLSPKILTPSRTVFNMSDGGGSSFYSYLLGECCC